MNIKNIIRLTNFISLKPLVRPGRTIISGCGIDKNSNLFFSQISDILEVAKIEHKSYFLKNSFQVKKT